MVTWNLRRKKKSGFWSEETPWAHYSCVRIISKPKYAYQHNTTDSSPSQKPVEVRYWFSFFLSFPQHFLFFESRSLRSWETCWLWMWPYLKIYKITSLQLCSSISLPHSKTNSLGLTSYWPNYAVMFPGQQTSIRIWHKFWSTKLKQESY